MLKVRDKEFDLQAEEIQALVAGALVDMPRAEVAVVIQPVTIQPAADLEPLRWFGPLLVSPHWLWVLLVGLFFWFAGTVAVVILWVRARRKNMQAAQDPAGARNPSGETGGNPAAGRRITGSR